MAASRKKFFFVLKEQSFGQFFGPFRLNKRSKLQITMTVIKISSESKPKKLPR
jgi:hypothetical protein